MTPLRRPFFSLVAAALTFSAVVVGPANAIAANCGVSGGYTVCVTPPSMPLNGERTITLKVSSPVKVVLTWVPDGDRSIYLMTQVKPNPGTSHVEGFDYSFVWPTQKYLDATGVLRVQVPSTASAPVDTPVTLSNGNAADLQHSPPDWASYLPAPWTGASDPVLAAVGDAAANEAKPNRLAATIAQSSPALLLYLGDVYEFGSFTEDRNHYGMSALDDASGATLWGTMAAITQPTIGNHEIEGSVSHVDDWTDYWHQRPNYLWFDFGGVRFFDLDSNIAMDADSPQYGFVQAHLPPPGSCIVAFWHRPVLSNSKVRTDVRPMWKLLANSGGDLVVNGHTHNMTAYKPLDQFLDVSAEAHMPELISGAGGHSLGHASTDPKDRIAFTLGKTAGSLRLTLNGAASGGTATSLSWSYRDIQGSFIAGSAGSVQC